MIERLSEDGQKSTPDQFIQVMRAMLNVSMSRSKAFKSIDSVVQKKFNKDLNEIIKSNVNTDPDVLNLFNTVLANSAEDVVPYVSLINS